MGLDVFFEKNQWLWIPLLVWSSFWKGLALWRAAGRKDKIWFVGLFLINTVGLLEIFYLFLWPKFRKSETAEALQV